MFVEIKAGSADPALRAGYARCRDDLATSLAVARSATQPYRERTDNPEWPGLLSALDAAAQVIAGSKEPMRATDMIAAMEAKGLWKSPGGKTPEATLYAAIIREIAAKGKDARFAKHDRGLFVAGKGA